MKNDHCETLRKFIDREESLMRLKGIRFERVYNGDIFAGWRIETAELDTEEVVNYSKDKITQMMEDLKNGIPVPIDITRHNRLYDSKSGVKESDGKLNYELDWNFIEQMAQRMSQNKGKYPPNNWKKEMDVEKLKQSLFRHVIEIMKGNYSDDGREFGHYESIALNAMMINYQLNNPQVQYKKEDFINK